VENVGIYDTNVLAIRCGFVGIIKMTNATIRTVHLHMVYLSYVILGHRNVYVSYGTVAD